MTGTTMRSSASVTTNRNDRMFPRSSFPTMALNMCFGLLRRGVPDEQDEGQKKYGRGREDIDDQVFQGRAETVGERKRAFLELGDGLEGDGLRVVETFSLGLYQWGLSCPGRRRP